MLVKFIGGSLNDREFRIDRYYEYIEKDGEMYYAKSMSLIGLNWVYVWYEFSGKLDYIQ